MKIIRMAKTNRLICLCALVVASGTVIAAQVVTATEREFVSTTSGFEQFTEDRQIPDNAPAKAAGHIPDRSKDLTSEQVVSAQLESGAAFVPINPYRSYDSRAYSDGLMLRGDEIYFDVLTNVNGIQQIPSEAVAVTYNITVAGTYGSGGYLAVYPADINWPGNSSINWFATGLNLANGGVVALGNLDGPGQIAVYCGNVFETATDFIIDITGYYV